MNNKKNESAYVQEELEIIENKVSPYMKKNLIFSLLSIPLIFFSVLNLYTLVVYIPLTGEATLFVLVSSIAGALGMAFFKESKHYSKIIHDTSLEYIQGRIKKSTVPEPAKKSYLSEIQDKPYRAFKIFNEFLQQEEKITNEPL